MTEVTLMFGGAEQPSVQIGDIIYSATTSADVGGFEIANQTNVERIGKVTFVGREPSGFNNVEPLLVIRCDMNNDQNPPAMTDFILFSKDNTVNMTSLLGYYGSAKFKNDSTTKAEMFATSCEINVSSK